MNSFIIEMVFRKVHCIVKIFHRFYFYIQIPEGQRFLQFNMFKEE